MYLPGLRHNILRDRVEAYVVTLAGDACLHVKDHHLRHWRVFTDMDHGDPAAIGRDDDLADTAAKKSCNIFIATAY